MTGRSGTSPESVFDAFLARRAAGEELGIDDLCAEHPERADELRRLDEQQRRVQAALPSASFFGQRERGPPVKSLGGIHAGQVLGDFRLLEFLDLGGMGQVWVAEQLSVSRRVALKLMLPERVNEQALELFAREARAGGRLTHPGVVVVHGCGTSDGLAWIAMELVEGSWTLNDFVREARSSGELAVDHYRRSAELLAQVADALQAAHDAGVVHRDVKPANILITPDDRPKVSDFGLARIEGERTLCGTGTFLGSRPYMSPEQVAAGRAGVDHRTDIFSLGVVAHELLSLRRPFEGTSEKEIADQILTREPPDLRRLRPDLPRDLALIIGKALIKDRRLRWQSMAELAADLRRFLAGEPIVARREPAARRLARRVRRHPTSVAMAGTVAATVLLYFGTRGPPPLPLPGEHLKIVTEAGVDRSPTFIGTRHLVFERRSPGEPPALWSVGLEPNLTPQRWSPVGESCEAPAVSFDGRWLAHESPIVPAGAGGARKAIVLRRLSAASGPLVWPAEEHERLEDHDGSLGGVEWSPRSSRFVYTLDRRDGTLVLKLHDAERPDALDRELERLPKGDLDHVQACFPGRDDRVVFADGSEIRTVMLDPRARRVRPQTLDCSVSRDLVWLLDGSILLARRFSWEASTRLYQLDRRGTRPRSDLEPYTIGGYSGLTVSADRSMLAFVAQAEVARLYLCSAEGAAPRELPVSCLPTNPVWTPDGRVLYSGDTTEGLRLFLFDPDSGSEEPLEFDLPELAGLRFQLDQPAFSQEGAQLVFRAKGEPLNGRCDPREWVVVAPWPAGRGAVTVIDMGGRHVGMPHVNDAGDCVIWCEGPDEATRVLGARLEAEELGDVEVYMERVQLPARISGDGRRIAAAVPQETSIDVRIVECGGEEIAIAHQGQVHVRPVWLPSALGAGGDHFAYMHWDDAQGDLWVAQESSACAPGSERDLCTFPAPPAEVTYATYDPRTRRLIYTTRGDSSGDTSVRARSDLGNLWLVRTDRRREPSHDRQR